MSTVLEDKKTKKIVGTQTSDGGRADTSTRNATRKYYGSRDESSVFSWVSAYTALTKKFAICVRNDSETCHLIIDDIIVDGSDGNEFEVFFVTGTPVGNPVVGTCLNRAFPAVAEASAKNSGVTGILEDGKIINIKVGVDGTAAHCFDGSLRLGEGDMIAVKSERAGAVGVSIFGQFEESLRNA